MAAHPDPDHAELGDFAGRRDFARANFLDDRLQNFDGLGGVRIAHGERDIGQAVRTDILDDDINIDIGVGNGLEHLRGDPGLVGDAGDGDLGLFLVNRDAANDDVFHFRSFGFHDGSWVGVETAADLEYNIKLFGEFHGPRLHDFRAERGHFQHFVVADFKNLFGVGDDAGIGGIDAVHIGVNLTDIGFHCGGDGNGAEVAATTTECGDVAVGRFPLEAGNDDGMAGVE